MFDIIFSLYVRNVYLIYAVSGRSCILSVYKKENAERGLQWVTDRYVSVIRCIVLSLLNRHFYSTDISLFQWPKLPGFLCVFSSDSLVLVQNRKYRVLLHNGGSCNACTIKRNITLRCIPKQSTWQNDVNDVVLIKLQTFHAAVVEKGVL